MMTENTVTNIDRYQKDFERLMLKGKELLDYLTRKSKNSKLVEEARANFRSNYEQWYTEAYEVIRQILPNRVDDFSSKYKCLKRKELTYGNYTLSDYMIGLARYDFNQKLMFDVDDTARIKFSIQVLILQSAEKRFRSSLFDIKSLLRADLFDSELDAARELRKNGFLRAAGALAGVVLERHLAEVSTNHNIKVAKKDPTISIYNDLLKKDGVIDTPKWRFIQRLGDLRNLCDHAKDCEPTKEDVLELIDGTDKIIKTLF